VIAIGLMSGTSVDGVDAALVEIVPTASGYAVTLLRFETVPYAPEFYARLVAALPPHRADVKEVAELHVELGETFARAAAIVAEGVEVDYVASHGQTVYHAGDASVTLQIGSPFVIRERVGRTVIADFRSADCAAGGQGAPLVPYVDALLLGSADEDRVALNIGGIANITVIPRGARADDVIAFDTGPGNMLIDAFVSARTGGREHFDRDGAYAARGSVDRTLLASMLADAYFARRPPKSTGREYFGEHFLERFAARLSARSIEDGAATLTALTVESIVLAIAAAAPPRGRLLVSGGGERNPTLIGMLRERLLRYVVERSDRWGVRSDAKEAVAFAVLGYETLRGRSAGMPRVSGARHAALLGAIVPVALAELLAKVDREVARTAPA